LSPQRILQIHELFISPTKLKQSLGCQDLFRELLACVYVAGCKLARAFCTYRLALTGHDDPVALLKAIYADGRPVILIPGVPYLDGFPARSQLKARAPDLSQQANPSKDGDLCIALRVLRQPDTLRALSGGCSIAQPLVSPLTEVLIRIPIRNTYLFFYFSPPSFHRDVYGTCREARIISATR
jgi:hypothetical protein